MAVLGKFALVVQPHRHRRRSATCSVTTRRISGSSNTLSAFGLDHLGVVEVGSARRARGRCVGTTWSGSATWARCLPGAPGCLPCLRAAARRSARDGDGGFENPSADGGIDELRGFRPRRSSRSASFDSSIDTCARSSAFFGRQLLIGGIVWRGIAGRNSPRYARRYPWWWIRRSGGLNSYPPGFPPNRQGRGLGDSRPPSSARIPRVQGPG